MADDIAKLGIAVDSAGLKSGTQDLKDFSAASKDAAKAADVVGDSTKKSSSAFDEMAKKIAAANSTIKDTDKGVSQMGASINAALSKNSALFTSMANGIKAANGGLISNAEAAAKAAASHAALSAQGQALFHTTRSLAEQFLAGQVSVASFAQQIGHITFASTGKGGLSGAFSEVTGVLGNMLTPMRLAAAGAVGLAAAGLYIGYNWSESQAQIERAVIGIGAATGSTASDLNAFAKANASATGLTIGEARNVAIEFTKTGDIAVKNLKGVGDAVHGYAILTGEDATKATKDLAGALSGDLVKGAQELNKTYMAFDAPALDFIQNLQTTGERAKATQFIIDSIAPANLKAADSVNILTKSYQFLAGVMSSIKNGPPAIVNGGNPQDRLQQAQSLKQSAGSSFSGQLSGGFGSDILSGADSVPIVNQLDDAIKTASKDAENFGGISKEAFVKLSTEAKNATDAIFPQIEQIRRLEVELSKLEEAKSKGASGPNVDDAINAYKNQIAGLEQSVTTANLYNTRVKEISKSWGDVDQSTALSLQAAQNQLPVLQAVGGAAKMSAQYAADYANYMDFGGKTSTEAAALAASNLRAAQAQVNSAAKETLATLRDQAAVAGARTPLEAAAAQAQATYNGLLRQGVDSEIAFSVASQQAANAQAQIFVQMQKVVKSSQDQLDLAQAAGTGSEALVKSSIAYSNAMDAGATSAQAAVISVNALYTELTRAAKAAEQLDQAQAAAEYDAQHNKPVTFEPDIMKSGPLSFVADPRLNVSYANGGTGRTLDLGLITRDTSSNNPSAISQPYIGTGNYAGAISAVQNLRDITGSRGGAASFNVADQINQIDTLTQLRNGMTNDKSEQLSNLQAEMSWLNSLPETLARDQKIVDLKQSIDQLKNSTDSLTSAQQASLNPLYSGRGALAVGYYHAATGLDMVAQGSGGTDSIPFHAMVSPGEHIKIGSPANQNDSKGMNLTQIINVSGDDTPQRRRNAIQAAQGFVSAAR